MGTLTTTGGPITSYAGVTFAGSMTSDTLMLTGDVANHRGYVVGNEAVQARLSAR